MSEGYLTKLMQNTHALATDEKVAPFQLAKDFEELFEEPRQLRCELVIVGDTRLALGESSLRHSQRRSKLPRIAAYIPRPVDQPRGRCSGSSSSTDFYMIMSADLHRRLVRNIDVRPGLRLAPRPSYTTEVSYTSADQWISLTDWTILLQKAVEGRASGTTCTQFNGC